MNATLSDGLVSEPYQSDRYTLVDREMADFSSQVIFEGAHVLDEGRVSLATLRSLECVSPNMLQCIEELSQANERLRQNQEHLMTLATASQLQSKCQSALASERKAMECMCRTLAYNLAEPVRGMRNLPQLLLEEDCASQTKSGKDYARVTNAIARLERLLQDLQIYGHMNHQALTLAPVSLETSVRSVIGELIEIIDAKGAEVRTVGQLPEVEANYPLLRHVLFNLFDNALKFVEPEVAPSICVRTESRPAVVRIYVEDNGIGVSPEHHERIFGLFERLSDTYPGNGLGLAVVRESVERMGGHAGVESQPGKGSRFWIELRKPH